jgi:hypothetical protein
MNAVNPPQPPSCQLTRKTEVRRCAFARAREWGMDCTRLSPSFFAAVEEATARTIAQLCLANGQGKPRKTLR